MKSEKEKRHRALSKKSLVVLIVLLAVTVSMIFSYSLPSIVPKPTIDSMQQNIQTNDQELTKKVADQLVGIPLDCYIIYTEANNTKNNSTSITLYNETTISILKTSLINGSANKFETFMYTPEVQLYFYNNCKFFDNRSNQLPKTFNPQLGVVQTKLESDVKIEVIREQLLQKYPFVEYASKEREIKNLELFYMMNPQQVVYMLIKNHLLDLKKDCILPQGNSALKCTWKDSEFYYDEHSGSVLYIK